MRLYQLGSLMLAYGPPSSDVDMIAASQQQTCLVIAYHVHLQEGLLAARYRNQPSHNNYYCTYTLKLTYNFLGHYHEYIGMDLMCVSSLYLQDNVIYK